MVAAASEALVTAATILVVEDEIELRELLRSYFERDGAVVLSTGYGAEALALARRGQPDIVILDLGLPDVPGADVVQELRTFSDVPVIILTARSAEADRVQGLELGADDYVVKPFSPRELVLRVQAVLRRGQTRGYLEDRLSFGRGEVIIDVGQHQLTMRASTIDLTPTEWSLLRALAASPGRVCSRFELINRVRGYDFEGYERTVDTHIKNLRRKVEADPRRPRIIETVLGHGYRFCLRRDD